MNASTIARLNEINQQFYRTTAHEFDQTRGQAWPGWLRLLPLVQGRESLRVLDVGCGNGRLGVFLAENLPGMALYYHGMDTDEALLAHADEALSGRAGLIVQLERRDIVLSPPDAGTYDLVALFGVMHHVPGHARREVLVRALAARVAPGGLLAFACWRFYEYARFRRRIEPWPDDLAGQVEPGDYLLDWRRGERALRYCHYVDDAEHDRLLAAAGLSVVETYRADGRSGEANQYSILRRDG